MFTTDAYFLPHGGLKYIKKTKPEFLFFKVLNWAITFCLYKKWAYLCEFKGNEKILKIWLFLTSLFWGKLLCTQRFISDNNWGFPHLIWLYSYLTGERAAILLLILWHVFSTFIAISTLYWSWDHLCFRSQYKRFHFLKM